MIRFRALLRQTLCPMRLQNDFDAPVPLIAESLVHGQCIVNLNSVGDDG